MHSLQSECGIGPGSGHTIAARLKRYGQEHLLRFWDELSDIQRRRLAEQIDAVDLPLLEQLLRDEKPVRRVTDLAHRAEPPAAFRANDSARLRIADDARRCGELALREGKVGVIVVAGGQGTRLGRECPKGVVPVGPVSGRSLLQILIDRILAVGNRYGVAIPLYLMTSPATHSATLAFLTENNHFGLSPENLIVFRQGVMPTVCLQTGKVLMADRDSLCLAPNGHGGMLEALTAAGALDDAALRGVEHFFYCQVDNPLAPCCDPELIGLHLLTRSQMTTLAVAKEFPTERVGNVVTVDGRVQILEYSELPVEVASQCEADSSLRLWAGNTGIHLFDARFLRCAAATADALPYHRAHKATPCLDDEGRLLAPEHPNSLKFERFIFDLLPLAETATVIEAVKSEAFAPVKNGSDKSFDTAETAQAAMAALYRNWLAAAGVQVVGEPLVEINPKFALDAAELAARLAPGTRIDQPTYLV